MDLKKIYARRFTPDLAYRAGMWRILCRDFFQDYVDRSSRVVEIGAGYCEFINNIEAAQRTAVDINPDLKQYTAPGVKAVLARTDRMRRVRSSSADVVFASNFFEHLTREEIVGTLHEVHRVLAPGGRFMILQPNVRFCGRDYWMFFDHVTPIDDRALVEVLEVNGFEMVKVIPRFLPYSTKSALPRQYLLIRLSLRLPVLWRLFGQQSFLLGRKPNESKSGSAH